MSVIVRDAVEYKNLFNSIINTEFNHSFKFHAEHNEDNQKYLHGENYDTLHYYNTNLYFVLRRLFIASQLAYWYQYNEFAFGELRKDFLEDIDLESPKVEKLDELQKREINSFLHSIRYNLYTNAGHSFADQKDVDRLNKMIEVTEKWANYKTEDELKTEEAYARAYSD